MKNLVVVRAGNNSLHHKWLHEGWSKRNFDLIVSYFNEDAFSAHQPYEGVKAVLIKGGKWDGLHKTIQALPEILDYERVWLPDDDINTTTATISRLFDLAKTEGCKVCQPALTSDSYYTYQLLQQCPSFKLRYVNLIEVMVPCLTRDTLRQVWPLFETTMSGAGLDWIWCRLWPDNRCKAVVFDEITVQHTRPIGTALEKVISTSGAGSSMSELDEMFSRFDGELNTYSMAYEGVLKNGKTISPRWRMALVMLSDWNREKQKYKVPKKAATKIRQQVQRHLLKSLNLSQVALSPP